MYVVRRRHNQKPRARPDGPGRKGSVWHRAHIRQATATGSSLGVASGGAVGRIRQAGWAEWCGLWKDKGASRQEGARTWSSLCTPPMYSWG